MPLLPMILVGIVLVWWLGTFLCLVRLARGMHRLRKLRRTLLPPAEERVENMLSVVARQFPACRRVQVCESALAPAPLSFGLLRPTIVFPTGLAARLDDEQLRLVLRMKWRTSSGATIGWP